MAEVSEEGVREKREEDVDVGLDEREQHCVLDGWRSISPFRVCYGQNIFFKRVLSLSKKKETREVGCMLQSKTFQNPNSGRRCNGRNLEFKEKELKENITRLWSKLPMQLNLRKAGREIGNGRDRCLEAVKTHAMKPHEMNCSAGMTKYSHSVYILRHSSQRHLLFHRVAIFFLNSSQPRRLAS